MPSMVDFPLPCLITGGSFQAIMVDTTSLLSTRTRGCDCRNFEMTYSILLSKDLLMGSGIFKNYIRDKSGGLWSRSISEYIQVQWTCSRFSVVDSFHVLEIPNPSDDLPEQAAIPGAAGASSGGVGFVFVATHGGKDTFRKFMEI